MVSFLLLKAYSTLNLHIQTSIIMPECKALPTNNFFAVAFGVTDVDYQVFGRYALATPNINQTKSSLQVETKQPSMGALSDEQISETVYPTFEILTETFFKVRIGTVENLLVVLLFPITIQQKSSPASL